MEVRAFSLDLQNRISQRRWNYIWLINSGIRAGNADQVAYNKAKLEELEELVGIIHGR